MATPDKDREVRLIAFRVGPETFALDIMAVRQIIPYKGSTSVPTAPPFVEGVIVVNNVVVPVIDLRTRLYPGVIDNTTHPLVLITRSAIGPIALKVDEVRRIITVRSDALLPAPPIVNGVRGEFLIAVIKHFDRVFLLIDLESVLSADEKQELQSADLSPSSSTTSTDVSAGTSDR
jgi:purine-binding chemotaxis protein CheW